MSIAIDAPPPGRLPRFAALGDPAKGWWLMGASLIFFTANALILRGCGAPAEVAVAVRGGVGLLVLVAIESVARARGPGAGLRLGAVFRRPLLVARGCLGAAGLFAYYWTIPRLGVGPSSVLCQLYGMFAALFAVPLLGERLRPRQLLWMLLSFGGIVLMQGGLRYESALPVAAGVLAAVLAGGVVVSIRALHRSESTPTIFAAQCAWCVILLAPIAFRGGQSGFSAGMLAGVVAGGFCAAAAQLALTQGFRYLTAASGSAAQMALPAFIGIGGVLLFGETYSLAGGIGVLLALGGAFLAVRRA